MTVLHKIPTSHTIGNFTGKNSQYAVYWVQLPGYFASFSWSPEGKPEKGGAARLRGEVSAICMQDPISIELPMHV